MIMASEQSSAPKTTSRRTGRRKPRRPAAARLEHASASTETEQSIPSDPTVDPGERRRRALLRSMADLVFWISKEGFILECHLPEDAAFPLRVGTLVGKRLVEILPVQINRQATHYLEKALRTGQTQTFTSPYLIGDKMRDFQVNLTASGPAEIVAVVRDITAQKLSEKEILEISNREQVRIGQDLHDGLGQHLTGVTFLSKALEKKLEARSLPEAGDAAEIGRLVLQALSQTRNLARGLFPVELESNELAPALRDLAATVENLFNISCQVESEENLVVADRAVVNHIFRLAQEAINNSVKHGKAKRVFIQLKTIADKTILTIRDDGTGFAPESIQAKGLGLRIMNYRAQKIGGTLEIHPAEGGGTIVTCAFQKPLKED